MIEHQGLRLYPLTPDLIAARPDLDPLRRDEMILRRGGMGWVDLEGNRRPAWLIRDVCRPGDALYYWDGPWGALSGSRGIAVVRDGRVVETFATVMA